MFLPILRKAGVWIAFLLFATAAFLANTAHATEALSKCCVWRVTNAKAPFYLVGSVHALGRDDYPLPSPYELASKDAKRLLFEFNPNREKLTYGWNFSCRQDAGRSTMAYNRGRYRNLQPSVEISSADYGPP